MIGKVATKVVPWRSFLVGGAAGAGLTYYFDRQSGRRRRAGLRDKMVHLEHVSMRGLRKAGVDLQNRAHGVAAIVQRRLERDEEDVPDEILVERVRARMGFVVSHPHAVEVLADDGVVTLRGPILAPEAPALLRRTMRTPGVCGVRDDLEKHESAEGVAALQGGCHRVHRPELLQENWAPAIRLLAGAGGAAMVLGGIGARSGLSKAVGAGLLARSILNMPLKRILGFGGARGVEIDKSMHIDAAIEEVFAFFANFENLPQFMAHLESVQGNGRKSLWTAVGPAGIRLSWRAETTRLVDEQLIAWRSLPGSIVRTAGCVRFEREGDGTRLSVRMSYNPPAGTLGHVVAALFGADAKHALDEDLLRLKSLLENGKASVHGKRVTLDELEPRLPSGDRPSLR
jgi:uncharacterized membrane protein